MSSIVESVFEQSLVKDSSANTAYVHLLSKDRLAMYMHLLLKTNKTNNIKNVTYNIAIAYQQKAGKHCRDDSIKQFRIQTHLTYLSTLTLFKAIQY